jgi:pimeloyl-ACP methyl ester carboxylesterase
LRTNTGLIRRKKGFDGPYRSSAITALPAWDAIFTREGGRSFWILTPPLVVNGKPSPDIYVEAARRLEIPCAQCVALEDSDAGIIVAGRAGMLPLLIPDMKRPSHEAAAVFVIQGTEDFTTPTSLARSFLNSLRAPRKAFVTVEGGGHFSVFMKSDVF